jgi:trk system potassium uptake protein TrkH
MTLNEAAQAELTTQDSSRILAGTTPHGAEKDSAHMKIQGIDKPVLLIILLGLVSIILENASHEGSITMFASHVLDVVVSVLFVFEFMIKFVKAGEKLAFIKETPFETAFVMAFVFVLIYTKFHFFFVSPYAGHSVSTKIVLVVSLFIVFKVLMRVNKLHAYVRNLTTHPAQTIMLSFCFVILTGTILLMMPFSTADHTRLPMIDSLFMATSATCVTGLGVVDAATRLSVWGKLILMALIQIGGLGIMILASFTAFLVGKRMSFQEKRAMSYMLEEDDTRNLTRGVRNIIVFTFLFELAGAFLLFPAFQPTEGGVTMSVFYSVFHAVSAFCNAGFALFTDSLVPFRSSLRVNATIAGLIIAGGISFAVLTNSFRHIRSRVLKRFFNNEGATEKLNLNTRIVLLGTLILIVTGTLLIYKFEHGGNLLPLDIKTQYLEAFFQSVTLRTAGFNTMDISNLQTATYAIMILFMFIGGASGSTAGGIKVNTVGVVWSYVKSVFSNNDDVVLLNHSISKDQINQAFLVMLLSMGVVFCGTLLLCLSEKQTFVRIIFEAVSAFATVGLSTGITPDLSGTGKLTLVVLMFIGRIGPLTVVTAVAGKALYHGVKYPEGKIYIG